MTKKHLITDPAKQDQLAVAEKFSEYERLYLFGNKMALYDAVILSNELRVGLPNWAAKSIQQSILQEWGSRKTKWKGEPKSKNDTLVQPIDGYADVVDSLNAARDTGYIALLKSYLRAKVYRCAMLWVQDVNKFVVQPTRTTELWFDGEIEHPRNAADALKVTEEGLVGTVAHCGVETLKDFISSDHLASIEKMSISDPEFSEHLEISPDEFENFQKSQIREHLRIPFEFGRSKTEVDFGLRNEGQFWGPKRQPPDRIRRLLSSHEPPIDLSSSEDF